MNITYNGTLYKEITSPCQFYGKTLVFASVTDTPTKGMMQGQNGIFAFGITDGNLQKLTSSANNPVLAMNTKIMSIANQHNIAQAEEYIHSIATYITSDYGSLNDYLYGSGMNTFAHLKKIFTNNTLTNFHIIGLTFDQDTVDQFGIQKHMINGIVFVLEYNITNLTNYNNFENTVSNYIHSIFSWQDIVTIINTYTTNIIPSIPSQTPVVKVHNMIKLKLLNPEKPFVPKNELPEISPSMKAKQTFGTVIIFAQEKPLKGVFIEWNTLENATSYALSRSVNGENFELLATFPQPTTDNKITTLDTTVRNGNTYIYGVRVFYGNNTDLNGNNYSEMFKTPTGVTVEHQPTSKMPNNKSNFEIVIILLILIGLIWYFFFK